MDDEGIFVDDEVTNKSTALLRWIEGFTMLRATLDACPFGQVLKHAGRLVGPHRYSRAC